MLIMKTRIQKLLVGAALVGAATLVQAQYQSQGFNYNNNGDNTCTITGYTGPGGAVTIPNSIPWTPPLRVVGIGNQAFYGNSSLTSIAIPDSVTSIGNDPFGACGNLTAITVDAANSFFSSVDGVLFYGNQSILVQCPGGKTGNYVIPAGVTNIGGFDGCFNLTGVTIPDSVTSIGDGSFFGCTSLTSVTIPASVTRIGFHAFVYCPIMGATYFLGNAPGDGGFVFGDPRRGYDPVIVYYLPGATGWGPFFSGVPTKLWNPQASALGVTGGHFGFNITGPSYTVIVVEACTNLAQPVWLPVSTNALDGSGASSFSDPQWTNYPARFYRLRSP